MSNQILGEVFGFPAGNVSTQATYVRDNKLCPFNNKGPRCTKDSVSDPLGVCSVREGNEPTITCPIRFRQDWIIAVNAAAFFFPGHDYWTALTEVRLPDKYGQSAGNLDLVIVAHDVDGKVLDFGAVEVQAVYISGNVRVPFRHYMENSQAYLEDDERAKAYVRPDYLSSSRKRLAPQLIYKGGILKGWGKKLAVVLQTRFFATLPSLPLVGQEEAEIAWMLYDLVHDQSQNRYNLTHRETVYTQFKPALDRITIAEAGPVEDFMKRLQKSLDEKRVETRLDGDTPSDAPVFPGSNLE